MSLGGTDINPPDFSTEDFTQGLQSSGAALASRYNQLGLGNSTMLTQDENANAMKWAELQNQANNQLLQQSFTDQLAAANQGGSGFLSGLFTGGSSLAGGLGGLGLV